MRSLTKILAVLVLLALALPRAWAVERPFAVITAPGATAHRLTSDSVALIFRRKQNYWESGTRIQPVNLPPTHPLRRAFSQSISGILRKRWRTTGARCISTVCCRPTFWPPRKP